MKARSVLRGMVGQVGALVPYAVLPKHHRMWTCARVFETKAEADSFLETLPRGHYERVRLTLPKQTTIEDCYLVHNNQRSTWWMFRKIDAATKHKKDERHAYRGEGASVLIIPVTLP